MITGPECQYLGGNVQRRQAEGGYKSHRAREHNREGKSLRSQELGKAQGSERQYNFCGSGGRTDRIGPEHASKNTRISARTASGWWDTAHHIVADISVREHHDDIIGSGDVRVMAESGSLRGRSPATQEEGMGVAVAK